MGFSAEIDSVDEHAWYGHLEQFDDANIYQTWAYDEVRCGRQNISHLVLKEKGEVVAVAQARIAKLPVVPAGIAYVRWGPLWRRRNREARADTFRQAIRALRNEYAANRGLVLRLYPRVFDYDFFPLANILEEEGFAALAGKTSDRTLLMDVDRPLPELRAGLKPHWGRELKVAEKNGLEVVEGSDDELFAHFVEIYKEMVARKKFTEPNDIRQFQAIQRRLPEKLRMRVMMCRSNGNLCAGLVCSLIGDSAIYLFGATSDSGLKSRGSYLLHWKLLDWLKQNGCTTYDLNGINPVANPGTFKFKRELCGDGGKDVEFLGQFDSYSSVLSRSCVVVGEKLRRAFRGSWKLRK